jgi:predicted amidophosphoribosyltransferase
MVYMAKTRTCPECETPVRLNKRYCPECHETVNPRAPEDPIKLVKDAAELKSMMLLGLGGMALFFSFGFFLPAMLAESGFIWVSAGLFVVGMTMVMGAWAIKVRTRKRVAEMEKERHVACEYCGGVNDLDLHRCTFCGAPLPDKMTSSSA